MSGRRGMQGALTLLVVQVCVVTSCVSAPEDGVGADLHPSTGGTIDGGVGGSAPVTGGTGVGGNDGEWTPTGGTLTVGVGGVPAVGGGNTGGQAGAPASCYGTFYPDVDECGECRLTLDQLCIDSDCSMPEDLSCDLYGLPTVIVYRGCGYVRKVSQGDVGDWWAYTWLEENGELAHFYSQPTTNYGCYPPWTAGEMPYCPVWEMSCESEPGTGGLGGGSP